jgi:pimeloyl-ACP methyl ester carboxylesterase
MHTDKKMKKGVLFICGHLCQSVATSLLAFLFLLCGAPSILAAEAAPKASDDYLLHLPGIAGYHWVDRQFLAGLREGGFEGEQAVRNWPGDDPGLAALLARKRNQTESRAVADAIVARARANPGGRIILTGHSGGAGIAVWALEKLPEDVKVDTVLLLAPALSPGYDLTRALSHVRGTMYAFTSTFDAVVLGAGTTAFGTIDGVRCEAAGRWGFVAPEGADEKAYEKLVQVPYDAKWMRDGNIGDHIGPMGKTFAKNVLTPLVVGEARAQKEQDPPPAKGQAPATAAPQTKELASSRQNVSPDRRAAPPPKPVNASHAP